MSFADWLASEGIERELDVLYVSPAQLRRAGRQLGTQSLRTWSEIADWLSMPSVGASKEIAGGWSPALYREGHRSKAALVHVHALVVDVDGNGDVDRLADELETYDAIVHETFSSTNDDPRCRVVLRLAEPVDAATYEATHAVVRATLRAALGAITDDGAKDASRLSYAPVRREGASYRYRRCRGRPLDAVQIVAAQPPPPPRARVEIAPQHRDAYARAALRKAAEAIGAAAEGARHETLNREAYALARLPNLSTDDIFDTLLPAAVAAMGERRRREVERTIADAVRARKGAA